MDKFCCALFTMAFQVSQPSQNQAGRYSYIKVIYCMFLCVLLIETVSVNIVCVWNLIAT